MAVADGIIDFTNRIDVDIEFRRSGKELFSARLVHNF
jgi:hypothetical protein